MNVTDRSWWWTALLGAAVMVGCASEPQYPNCNGDTACNRDGHHGVCVRGHCQQCRADSECGAGERCVDNRCEASPTVARAECRADNDCAAGRACEQGRCVAARDTVTAHAVDHGTCEFAAVHFAFDDATLDNAAERALQQTADCLARERTTRYVLVGRADPRGTTEYNLALGERRARAVQHYLTALGVDEARLAVSSVGSEGAEGTDESGWATDRRVDSNTRPAAATPQAQGAHGAAP